MKTLIYILTLALPFIGYGQLVTVGGPSYDKALYNHCEGTTATQFNLDITIDNISSYDVTEITWEVQYTDASGNPKTVTNKGASPSVLIPVPQVGALVSVWYKKGQVGLEQAGVYNPINVFAEQIPIVNLSKRFIVCDGEAIAINPTITNYNPSAFYKYKWTDEANAVVSSTSGTFAPTDTGKYFFEVSYTVPQNCKSKDSILVKNITPIASLGNDIDACRDEEVTLTNNWTPTVNAPNSLNYIWDGTPTNENTYTKTSNGLVFLKIIATEDGKSCTSNKDSVEIIQLPTPFVDLGADISVVDGPVLLKNTLPNGTREANFSYSWKDATGLEVGFQNTLNVINRGVYTLIVTDDPTNCATTKDITVKIKNDPNDPPEPKGGTIFVATAFAPEGNVEENKFLRVNQKNISESDFNFTVFDRWGGIVYETDKLNLAESGWDGESAPSGVYTFTVTGRYLDGTLISESGTSTLIK